jgi:glycosyltransferase involved in cell wall biosynthesis
MKEKAKKILEKIKHKINPGSPNHPIRTIAVCAAQVPFSRGGAEEHVDSLVRELKARGFDAELINIPFKWYPRQQLIDSMNTWESLDLSEADGKPIDMVIATKFPSYFVKHHNKAIWLTHQYRQAYDLLEMPFSGFDPGKKNDRRFREEFVKRDTNALRQFKRIYTIAANTAARLEKYNHIDAIPLYHPPKLYGKYCCTCFGDYIFSVGRLDPLKRVDLLVKGLKHSDSRIKCKIAGKGPEMENLKQLARQYGVSERVEFLGYVTDDQLVELYAQCAFVFFAPHDEDYGYITLEAFLSRKPVVTAFDSGGPLEFVKHQVNGIILDSLDENKIGEAFNVLFFDREKCRALGIEGHHTVKDIGWDHVIRCLVNGPVPGEANP